MEHVYENRLCVSLDELCFNAENGSNRGKMRKKNNNDDDATKKFTSKNLETERKRREKLSTRLLMLRSLVPIITNMNKATIIVDAITYIKMLKDEVDSLSQELHQMEATSEEIADTNIQDFCAVQEMKKWGIQEELQMTEINGNKMWVKVVIEQKRGRFNKLVKAMNDLDIEVIDTSVTTLKGAYLITMCIQEMNGERLEVHRLKQLLPNIIKII